MASGTYKPAKDHPWRRRGHLAATRAMPKVRDYKVAQGGLMRCCIEALDNRADENVPPGQVITCPHCHDSIKLVDGVWRWSSLKE